MIDHLIRWLARRVLGLLDEIERLVLCPSFWWRDDLRHDENSASIEKYHLVQPPPGEHR